MLNQTGTKSRIVEAARLTLTEEGFAGASARAIARRGRFNQALIFYHFGTLTDLLLAALDLSGAQRMSRYRAELAAAGTFEETIRVATRLYREDLDAGHITVLSELIGASIGRPDLAAEVVARVEPWIDLVEEVMRDALAGTIFEAVVNARTAAFVVVSVYLGVDLLSHLDPGAVSRAESVFELAGRLAQLLPAMGGTI